MGDMTDEMRCHTCKHWRAVAYARPRPLERQRGECKIMFGDSVDIYANDAAVEGADVDALWGCRSWEGRT